MSSLTPCRPLYLHGVLFSREKGRDTVKKTYEKDLRGQYLLNAMEEMTMNVTVDRLLSGNQEKDTVAFFPEVQELLADCSVLERVVLTEIVCAAKRSIRTHKLSHPP